ncbi:MAG: hypothetical protein K1X63_03805 [Chitinophagales bacterium]|nr:hypothetical protein [Chitinophagales bacterium]
MDEVIDRMNAYAISRLKSVGAKTIEGKSPVDFVGDLILKVMEGERDWATAECSFKEFLFGCLKSDISNYFRTLKVTRADELPEIPVDGISPNIDDRRNQVCELLKQEGADDDELMVFEYWMDGIFKPTDIANDLGVPVKEIYVIIKRLERRRGKIETQAINIV